MRHWQRPGLGRVSLLALVPALTAAPVSLVTPAAAEETAEGAVREVGQLVLDGIPEIPDRIVEKMNQYANVRGHSFAAWDPAGGIVIATRFGETTQLHHVAAPGMARRQLTFFTEPVGDASFGTEPGWFLFTKDFGGNEAAQIFRFNLKNGEATLLTDGEGQNGGPLWSNAKDRVAWRSTMRNQTDHDIWVMDPKNPDAKRIALQTEGYWSPTDWSPDDRRILASHYVSANESYLWWFDVKSGEKHPIGRQEPVDGATIAYGAGRFDASGDGVFYTSDEGSEHQTLRWRKLGSEDSEELTGDIPWTVGGIVMSPDRKTLAFSVNVDGADEVYLMDTKSRKRTKVDLPLGVLGGVEFRPDGKTIAFTLETTAAPTDVYTLDVASKKVERWTQAEVGGLDTSTFVTSEIIHFPTFDQGPDGKPRQIPAFIYKPEGEGPFPVIVRIHGGPESQSRAWFSFTSQYYVNELGCAVIYPNVRGSDGFGKSYLLLDNGFKREDSVKDIGALLDWIATQPDLDATRVGVTGGSYGGYMTLAVLTHYSDRVRCGVESVGISNFVTFLENTKDYRRDLRRVEYGDERDPAMREHLEKISPTTNADKIDVPLMVVQGANDPRVPASEAEQIVDVVRGKGKEVWYMLAKDEGHGFRKKSNVDQMVWGLSLFWENYLLPKEPPMTMEKRSETSSN
ncbi:MAG: S9 family peptidase [Gemmatimonadetes bacterium]|nr:S9 family peptidase [Gemmatimonadota bacterium]